MLYTMRQGVRLDKRAWEAQLPTPWVSIRIVRPQSIMDGTQQAGWSVQECAGVCRSVQECAGVCKSAAEVERKFKVVTLSAYSMSLSAFWAPVSSHFHHLSNSVHAL
jgi:hypothetical protein